jgi:hypothetical protein
MFPASNSTSGLMGVRSSDNNCDPRLNGLRWFAGTTGLRSGGGVSGRSFV